MSRITTPTESERIWDEACAEGRAIEGERNPETGQFEVTKWPSKGPVPDVTRKWDDKKSAPAGTVQGDTKESAREKQ